MNLKMGNVKLVSDLLGGDTPWQFRIMLFMVVIFFAGGLFLDHMASEVALRLNGDPSNPELDKLILEFTKEKHQSLTSSASLLYDFAKIALGALIASVTQNLKVNVETNGKNQDSES